MLLWPLRKPAGQVTSPPDPLLFWDSSSCSSSLLQWLTGKAWLSSHWTAGGKRDTSPEAQIVMSTRYSKLWSIRRARGNQMPLEMTRDWGAGAWIGKQGTGDSRGIRPSHSKRASTYTFKKESQQVGSSLHPQARTGSSACGPRTSQVGPCGRLFHRCSKVARGSPACRQQSSLITADHSPVPKCPAS